MTLYFASDRSGPWTIYSAPYSNATNVTLSGDGATPLTDPGASDDYAPTVSQNGGLMTFIRCSTSSTCRLYTLQAPFTTSTPVLQKPLFFPRTTKSRTAGTQCLTTTKLSRPDQAILSEALKKIAQAVSALAGELSALEVDIQ